uniref:Hypotheticial protein n=1 Tax=Schistosoma japonicum TaxID=6182 RepID=C1LDD3_SCHJA|nr:hypotheticial protein [Schistosoma japonicum]
MRSDSFNITLVSTFAFHIRSNTSFSLSCDILCILRNCMFDCQ